MISECFVFIGFFFCLPVYLFLSLSYVFDKTILKIVFKIFSQVLLLEGLYLGRFKGTEKFLKEVQSRYNSTDNSNDVVRRLTNIGIVIMFVLHVYKIIIIDSLTLLLTLGFFAKQYVDVYSVLLECHMSTVEMCNLNDLSKYISVIDAVSFAQLSCITNNSSNECTLEQDSTDLLPHSWYNMEDSKQRSKDQDNWEGFLMDQLDLEDYFNMIEVLRSCRPMVMSVKVNLGDSDTRLITTNKRSVKLITTFLISFMFVNESSLVSYNSTITPPLCHLYIMMLSHPRGNWFVYNCKTCLLKVKNNKLEWSSDLREFMKRDFSDLNHYFGVPSFKENRIERTEKNKQIIKLTSSIHSEKLGRF